jgi:hypothetical protein
VLEGTPDSAGFDAVFVDTFAEGYEGTLTSSRELWIADGRFESFLWDFAGYTGTWKWGVLILERFRSD